MSVALKSIVKNVLQQLKSDGITPTPENYRKVFCEQAQEHGFDVSECSRLSALAAKLSDEEQNELKKDSINDVDELFDFLVQKLRQKEQNLLSSNTKRVFSDSTVQKIASLMISSLAPSYVEDELEKNINNFTHSLKAQPSLLLDSHIQEDIGYYIQKRKEADSKAIKENASKINTVLSKLDTFIENTASQSGDSAKSLSVLSDELKTINFEDMQEGTFDTFRDKLVDISSGMANEASKLSNKLQKEQQEVSSLKNKVDSLQEHLKEVREQNATDFLTGALNRREYDNEIIRLNKQYEQSQENFCLVFIDLDYFKNINDTYGHEAGDVVLSTFAKLLLKKVGSDDVVARYGGEEFVIILPKSTIEDAQKFVEKIAQIVKKNKFNYEDTKIRVTFSAGIAQRKDFKTLEELVRHSDNLLYKAKKNGRDKIES